MASVRPSGTGLPSGRITRGEVVEAALTHVVRDQTEAAYARSDLFDRRRHLMTDWMQYLDPERGQIAAVVVATDSRMT